MGVRLHPRKTKYMPIKQGFTFCGWQYSIDDKGRIKCRVRTDRKRLTKKRMKRLSEDYCRGKVTSFDVKQKMNGTFAFLNRGIQSNCRDILPTNIYLPKMRACCIKTDLIISKRNRKFARRKNLMKRVEGWQ